MKKNIFFFSLFTLSVFKFFNFSQDIDINGPVGSGSFGSTVTILTNGNFVVTDPYYDEGGVINIGAVYLYNGLTKALISTLKGSTANDIVGSSGVTAISNGNYVVSSPFWDNGTIANAGAVTWGNGTTGITGVITSANSLVGSTSNDGIGNSGVTTLTNGNYVVASSNWDNGLVVNTGAVTWGNGTTGRTGVVSSANSLVGFTANDQIGNNGVTALTNGNYVVKSRLWDNGAVADVGAVTRGNGTIGSTGVITSVNSLVGSTASDQIGNTVTALTNGNYIVQSNNWDNGAIVDVGSVTWGNGTTGVSGIVTSSNSLAGSSTNDRIGEYGVIALTNGNYVVISANWDNGAVTSAGAVTWGDGTIGITGVVSSTNSLVGSTANDRIGYDGVTALTNGNYVVATSGWDNAAVTNAGAATWGDGTTGITGVVSSANSLVGSTANDQIGSGRVTALTNGNYVVASSIWDNGPVAGVGAVTWGNGTTGITGTITSANSLVGSTTNDRIGGYGVLALTNGNYVVTSRIWDNGAVADVGAVTWGNGTIGSTGIVTSINSLVGSSTSDQIGTNEGTALTNGNYVVTSLLWDNVVVADVGAVTWGNGTTGTTGVITSANSLVGSTANDQIGNNGVTALTNGNYVVKSRLWNNGAVANVGAVTWGDGTAGVSGIVTSSNSLVGSTEYDQIGSSGVTALTDGNYTVTSPTWDFGGAIIDAGAVTIGHDELGIVGEINSCNSVLGEVASGISGLFYNSINDYVIVQKTINNKLTLSKKFAPPVADAPSNITAYNSYTLPALSVGNYFTGSGGTGTALSMGNNITSPQTIYVYAESGTNSNCKDENSFVVNILDSLQLCGAVLTTMGDALFSDPVVGATDYRYWIQHLGTGYSTVAIRNAADNLFRMSWPQANPVKYGTTYTVRVSAYVSGSWQAYGSACNVTTPPTRLQPSSCGITVANLADAIYCYPVVDATKYRFQVSHAGSSFNQVANSSVFGNNFFRMSWFTSGVIPGANYTVQVAAYVGGTWSAYGPSCTITTPSTLTQLATTSCNVALPSMSTALYSDAVSGATNYRYKVVNSSLGFSKVITRDASDNLCRLTWTTGIQESTAYDVQVSAYLNSVWQAYGPVCTVTTSSFLAKKPTDEINSEQIGDLISFDTYPNPNNGDFTITSSHEGTFNITNELGQVIQKVEITKENNYQKKIEGLEVGVYFVTGTINNEVVTKKVIVM